MPFCENCGNEIAQIGDRCARCGHQRGQPASPPGVPAMGAPVAYGPRRNEGSAVASLVLGIAGIVVCPLVCSILAIVFGKQAERKIQADPSLDGEGMAKAGIVLGWVGIAVAAVGLIIVIIAASSAEITVRRF